MKHLTDEQKRIWDKYYSRLDAEQLMQAVVDSFIFAHSTKPGIYSFYDFKAEGLHYHREGIAIPGVIWRSQSKHKQVPEPKDENIQESIDRYYSDEATTMLITRFNRGIKFYSYYHEEQNEPLTCYITYHPLILKRIYELTEPFLYGQREDVQQLVKEYQAGNKELLQRIINQLGGLIDKAQKEFSYTGNKEVFTNLAGKINKKISKPKIEYNPGAEDHRLFLIMDPFKFDEDDLLAVIEKSVIDALASYDFNQGAQFKTWFYRIFNSDLIDVYRQYQRTAKRGLLVKSLTEDLPPGNHSFKEIIIDYRAYLNRLKSDQNELSEHLHNGFIEQLNKNQYKWLELQFKMQPNILSVNLTADLLNISLRTEYRTRDKLQHTILSRRKWSLPVFISDRKKEKPEAFNNKPAAACNNNSCNICINLFPNVNIKYRPCYGKINIKKEQRAVDNRPTVKPVDVGKGGYFWPKAKKDFELKQLYYDRLKRIT